LSQGYSTLYAYLVRLTHGDFALCAAGCTRSFGMRSFSTYGKTPCHHLEISETQITVADFRNTVDQLPPRPSFPRGPPPGLLRPFHPCPQFRGISALTPSPFSSTILRLTHLRWSCRTASILSPDRECVYLSIMSFLDHPSNNYFIYLCERSQQSP